MERPPLRYGYPGLAGRAGPCGPAVRQARTVPRTVRVRAHLLASRGCRITRFVRCAQTGCGKSVDEARCARPPSRLRCSAPHTAPPPGTVCRSTHRGGARREPSMPAAKGCPGAVRRASEAPRSAGFMARERSEPRQHFWRILFERSERSERSESCAGPWTRAPQGSRSEAQAASSARCAAPGQPFVATGLLLPIDASNVRNGSAVSTRCPWSPAAGP